MRASRERAPLDWRVSLLPNAQTPLRSLAWRRGDAWRGDAAVMVIDGLRPVPVMTRAGS